METITHYNQQALDFLEKHGVTIKIEFSHNGKYFDDDKDNRDIYNIELKRGNKYYAFQFGQSLVNSKKYVDIQVKEREYTTNGGALKGGYRVTNIGYLTSYCLPKKGIPPTTYDVLICLTKYNPGTFEDFCGEYGYDTDSISAKKTYEAVRDEYLQLLTLFSEAEMQELQEIN
jgi:hypothetical protein